MAGELRYRVLYGRAAPRRSTQGLAACGLELAGSFAKYRTVSGERGGRRERNCGERIQSMKQQTREVRGRFGMSETSCARTGQGNAQDLEKRTVVLEYNMEINNESQRPRLS